MISPSQFHHPFVLLCVSRSETALLDPKLTGLFLQLYRELERCLVAPEMADRIEGGGRILFDAYRSVLCLLGNVEKRTRLPLAPSGSLHQAEMPGLRLYWFRGDPRPAEIQFDWVPGSVMCKIREKPCIDQSTMHASLSDRAIRCWCTKIRYIACLYAAESKKINSRSLAAISSSLSPSMLNCHFRCRFQTIRHGLRRANRLYHRRRHRRRHRRYRHNGCRARICGTTIIQN
jgi:hypothetical protein